ncbi:hypothetical protein UFOVP211_39 [uncultured Caudovirales phage]|uniref:Uncharacterized protein n=1 Tax=uncultured Caudovirales phage TaxID=2100421 RepID=A0A6J7WPG7_9CAUD|nr:hypothetical protein UFOVP211_39 [uncultured Caudovirales phage]
MSNEKLSNEATNPPLRKGVVSGSTDFLSEQLPIVEYNDYEYKPHIAFYGTEWEIWYQSFNNRIPQNILMNKYGDNLNEALSKMINEVLSSGLKYYR